MNRFRDRGIVALALLLAGCSKSEDTDTTGANSASETTATTKTTSATETNTTGDGDACEEFVQTDTDFGPSVTVLIQNTRPDPIYVRTLPYGGEPPFALSNEDGELLWAPHYSCSIITCAQLIEGTCEELCPNCVCGEAIGIASGATYQHVWPGSLYEQTDLPAECNQANCPSTGCARPYQAPAGTYTVSVAAFTAVACDNPPCECPADDDTCTIETTHPDAFQGEELLVEAQLGYPGDAMVAITFD